MGFLQLLVVAVLASEHRVAGAAEVFGNSSEGLIEFSVGKFRYFELNRPFPEEAILHDISSNVTFLIFQIHSQYQNTTVSFSPTLLSNSSETGTASGLVFILRPEQSTCTWYLGTSGIQPVQNMAILLSYSERDPVPGGCNLEFDLDIDPNIYLEYNFFETTIKFAPANLGYARGVDPPPCDAGTDQDSRWRLQYDVYQYFLPENDLTEEMLLKHLQRMVSVPQVKASALKVVTLTANDKTSVSFSSLPGQGVIYNVIVWDPFLNTSAAYIPAHTYACSFEAGEGSCASLGRVSSKVFFTLFALLGFFICFFGHRFWKTELFFIGFIIMGFFFYILITRLTPIKYDVNLILTAVTGSVGGMFLVAVWWRFGILSICMLCVGLVLGFLISSVTFFTPLGNLKIFHDDGVFWVTFSCIAILIPVVFMGCLRILNILTCGVIGSYSVVLAIDSYWSTSLSYITLNVLKRALNKDFHRAFTNVPFQTNDFIILAVWGMLAVSGITLQIRRERGRPFFPPHPYKLWKQERERRVTNILDPSYHIPPLRERLYGRLTQIKGLFQKEQPAGERTPLLL
ncbi:transmembrane 7 superfamily member 3 [Homo sapiens]|uniref:Transmembrane 7 superfamily member 3 n=1 Tax=Homo sapiens TaxID=9606 RepID=TM7S3_HUMAN|nr:transmembrane 7 superfamily member 3 precursor [Homo sapiens]Q9NS93.1 RecName: Full=Transmembrane 7 superfamily member 3; AltName: Full=Seven span transmembrane protein; Flags: Precursor [Homo sapiens]AAH05176.1 Transmembrane 7 superfamily member 3 [Homo sapiens]EAW96542.1 transmembrane 7 superfamily member 3 [Homo sapiens]KAI2564908.1 transmembrane 7 superfamily member 3 [Homo sapiens]KAI4065156.1 transmembrane 7 superfamily member 3 [Homo sapiens]BAA92856.1 seven transmembrane protein TM|eukprot:NP_057635.1 transmembrane 7 superfamily member 3 precursor [Homo sapiens]